MAALGADGMLDEGPTGEQAAGGPPSKAVQLGSAGPPDQQRVSGGLPRFPSGAGTKGEGPQKPCSERGFTKGRVRLCVPEGYGVFASRVAALASAKNMYELVTTTKVPKVRPGVT
jgi:hypothetical protein